MRDNEAVLRPRRRLARLDRCWSVGDAMPALGELERVGGRWDTQSWTNIETRGFASKFSVFWEDGGVVMMIVGVGENGVEGR
jgi:hypothetical protein